MSMTMIRKLIKFPLFSRWWKRNGLTAKDASSSVILAVRGGEATPAVVTRAVLHCTKSCRTGRTTPSTATTTSLKTSSVSSAKRCRVEPAPGLPHRSLYPIAPDSIASTDDRSLSREDGVSTECRATYIPQTRQNSTKEYSWTLYYDCTRKLAQSAPGHQVRCQ